MQRVRGWVVSWLLLLGLWLLLTFNTSWAELIVGAAGAGLAATAVEFVRREGPLSFSVKLSWLARATRIPGAYLRDTRVIFGALFRRLVRLEEVSGAWRTVPLDWGTDDGRGAARRALITAAISVTPNAYVVSIDRDHNQAVVHQLVPSPPERAEEEVTGWL